MSVETKTPAISKDVTELSAKLKEHVVINDQGTLEKNDEIYLSYAPKEVKEGVKAVDDYDSLFATALLHAFGEKAVEHLKEHPENKRVAGEYGGGTAGRKFVVNYTAPSGKKADGTPKDPSVTVVRRNCEHVDHASVRHGIYAKTLELFS